MSLTNFIPQLWSARLLANLHKSLIFAQDGVINRDYEGEIRMQGDTVKINAIGPVTLSSYVKDTDMAAPQTLSGAQSILTISQQKYFNFEIDDVDAAQQNPKVMEAAMLEAGYSIGNDADQFVAGLYASAANTIGTDASAVVPTAATAGTAAYEYLVDLDVLLDEANVPDDGSRWVIVPPWYYGLLQKDPRFVEWQKSANPNALRTGEVGRASGFTVFQSNNVVNTAGAKYKILAGHPMAITFADQILKMEAYRPPLRFADAMKGLHLYGASVVRPTALACMTASKT